MATVVVWLQQSCASTESLWIRRKSGTKTGWVTGRWSEVEGVFRRSTWSSVCRGGSEQPWPEPGGPCRYSALRHGCPPHCDKKKLLKKKCKEDKDIQRYLKWLAPRKTMVPKFRWSPSGFQGKWLINPHWCDLTTILEDRSCSCIKSHIIRLHQAKKTTTEITAKH